MKIANAVGAEIRHYEEREREGAPVRVVVAERVYATDRADLWDALTNAERLPRWFLPVSGDLRLGGRYQLQGNAGGTILRCDPPEALGVTWEFAGGMSWVEVSLTAQADGTQLVLEHIAPVGVAEAHWESFGPGAVGVGWELAMLGLGLHLAGGGVALDPAAFQSWAVSDAGKAFVRACAAGWAQAHIAGGAVRAVAEGMAQRTGDFYTGEGGHH